MGVTLRSNSDVTAQCAFQVAWCPKYRRPVLGLEDGAIAGRLMQLITEVIEEKGAWLVKLEVRPDHVHLLVEVDPQLGIHRLVKAIKAKTSRALRDEFPVLRRRLPTLWTNAYFVATVGDLSRTSVKAFVESQQGV